MHTNNWQQDIVPNRYRRRDLLKAIAALGAVGALSGLPGPKVFADGTPLNEEAAYKLAMEAYVYGYPLIYFARLRYARMMEGDPMVKTRQRWGWGEWVHRVVPVTPAVSGAPQTDTLYSNLWLDLHAEPYILTVPKMDGRYWSLQFCDLFGSTYGLPNRHSLPKGGRVAVVGPNWQGKLPAGIELVLRAKMPQTFNVLRMFFADDADRLKAIEYQKRFLVAPLSAYLAGEASAPGVPANLAKPLQPQEDPLADFKTLQAMWQQCPPPAEDAAITSRYVAIGLAAGVHGFETLSPAVRKGLERAERDAREQVIAASRSLGGVRTDNGWTMPKPRIGYYDDGDYLYRAAVALAGTIAVPVKENPYHVLQREPSGALLSGDARYELRFAADQIPQADAFWSMHAYNGKYTVIANSINRYAISDRTQGLKYAADGSLTIYLQAADPGQDKHANWLPVKRGELFWLVVRAYEPRGAMKELRWKGPSLVRLS
jgi:hypothetical protein